MDSLPAGWEPVQDANEEIFWLYTRKAQVASSSGGLGFIETKSVLPISFIVTAPAATPNTLPILSSRKAAKRSKSVAQKDVVVELELLQDPDTLRNRKGDTGSVLWRVSIGLAKLVLFHHHFPSIPSLLPFWTPKSTVLELGSGSAFLGIALRKTVAKWIFSDQLTGLKLVERNLRKQGVVDADVREVDWVDENLTWLAEKEGKRSPKPVDSATPDIIVAADCIYNPSLSEPLARTIDRNAGAHTHVVVVSELRDSEPLELFLEAWMGMGWKVWRVDVPAEDQSGLGSGQFVVWVGKK